MLELVVELVQQPVLELVVELVPVVELLQQPVLELVVELVPVVELLQQPVLELVLGLAVELVAELTLVSDSVAVFYGLQVSSILEQVRLISSL